VQTKGKEALRGATLGNAPSRESPPDPMSPLLCGRTQTIDYHQLQPPIPGPSVLPDYGSTPRLGQAQLTTLEGRLPETSNHLQAPSATSETARQGWIDKAVQQMYMMLEDCGYMAD
jgi:hypothetical protein